MNRLLSTARLSLVARGDDLHFALVDSGPRGTTVRRSGVVPHFLAAPPETIADAIGPVPASAPTLFTIPSAWCAFKPVEITAGDWPKSRPEIVASLDQLLPFKPDQAHVGFLQLTSGGCLVAAPIARLRPWTERIELALNRTVTTLLATPMAVAGLPPFTSSPDAPTTLVERSGRGWPDVHINLHGRRLAAVRPAQPAATQPKASIELGEADGPDAIGPAQLAAAAAVAMHLGPGLFHPLEGRPPALAPRMALPAILAAAAAGLLIAAPAIHTARVDAATQAARAELRTLEPRADQVALLRERATAADTLLRESVLEPTSTWSSILPVLTEVNNAIGDDAYLFRLDVDPAAVSLRGEAPAADVTPILERLIASPLLADARLVAPTSRGSDTDLVSFDIRADRVRTEP